MAVVSLFLAVRGLSLNRLDQGNGQLNVHGIPGKIRVIRCRVQHFRKPFGNLVIVCVLPVRVKGHKSMVNIAVGFAGDISISELDFVHIFHNYLL